MCGITGFWEFTAPRQVAEMHDTLRTMAGVLSHRGPDGEGIWAEEKAGIGLGHCRLSIVDLSSAGSQPMVSRDGRFAITFNGEIYNAPEMKRELEGKGCHFRGHSDTEVLLEAIAAWGLEATLRQCIGMFAFALWDSRLRRLFLVRDRMGVKPLYYARAGDRAILFASQPKSFRQHPWFRPALSPEAAAHYFLFSYLPRGYSIYHRTAQVLPGHIAVVSEDGAMTHLPYWTLPAISETQMDEAKAMEKLEWLLADSVRLRMRADVPVGAFISGGVDSSVVASYMQAGAGSPAKTFCIGFADPALDESPFAKAVAGHLGTDHVSHTVTEQDILPLLPQLPEFYDEPFADFSMLPTLALSRLAREEVKVCLSGDGGDELFAGYSRYVLAGHLMALHRGAQQSREALLRALHAVPLQLWPQLGKILEAPVMPAEAQKLEAQLRRKTPREILAAFYAQWPHALPLRSPGHALEDIGRFFPEPLASVADMQRMDMACYLPDDILTKMDRGGMAYGLEIREPLLDHRLVEFACALPSIFKMARGQTKVLLRKVLHKHIPPSLIERPKRGFTPPLASWLRNGLRDWAENLLNPDAIGRDGILDAEAVAAQWRNHLSGSEDNSYRLWSILMFQLWKQYYRL